MNWEKAANYDREVSFQGRLDKVLEKQKIKLHDNAIKLTGTPEDVLVLKRKTTINGDTISKVITDQKLVNCIFPVLKDIPIRKITKEFEKGYTLTSLVSAYGEGSSKGFDKPEKNLTTIDVLVPLDANIDVDDVLVRVFVQNDIKSNTVMVFNVVEVVADFSNNAPLSTKVRLTVSTDPIDLNKPSYQLITALAKRRLAAKY